jgi:benzil reductase ((S)-benzoin forming)
MYNALIATIVFVSGASSGIGAAVVATVPYVDARVVGICRRAPKSGEHVSADLADPQAWSSVAARIEAVVHRTRSSNALFIHMAGVGTPFGTAKDAGLHEYTSSILLNCASGLVLGKAFLSACAAASLRATLVLCSSPATIAPFVGVSHYGAGKSAAEYWVRAIAEEEAANSDVLVFAVMPFAVDTPMLRAVLEQSAQSVPDALIDASARGALASAESAAHEIWDLINGRAASGGVFPIGAVPPGIAKAP